MLRSATAVAAGIAREVGDAALPGAFRRTKLYQSLVDSFLRFLIEQVGQVEGVYPSAEKLADNFLMRRAAGNGIEVLGLLTFRASPVWVLAALADLSGAGRHLLNEISTALQREGLLEQGRKFDSVDQMLDGLERTAGRLAETVNTPPLDVASLRKDWQGLKQDVATLAPAMPPVDTLWNSWKSLEAEAAAQKRSVFELSSVMGLAAVTRLPDAIRWLGHSATIATVRTGQLLAGTILDHYAHTLEEIRSTGYFAFWLRQFRPYLKAAAQQFSPARQPLTTRLFSRRNK